MAAISPQNYEQVWFVHCHVSVPLLAHHLAKPDSQTKTRLAPVTRVSYNCVYSLLHSIFHPIVPFHILVKQLDYIVIVFMDKNVLAEISA